MKKNTKKQPQPPTRQDWKNEVENEIELLQEDIDELDLPEEMVLAIEKKIAQFKERLNQAIDLFEITPEIAVENDTFLENMLDQVYWDKIPAGVYELDRMVDIIETNRGGQFVPTESLAEQIKLDEFLASTANNPYQLQLIA